jgi:hypothetical protein
VCLRTALTAAVMPEFQRGLPKAQTAGPVHPVEQQWVAESLTMESRHHC